MRMFPFFTMYILLGLSNQPKNLVPPTNNNSENILVHIAIFQLYKLFLSTK